MPVMGESDMLTLKVTIERLRPTYGKARGVASVEGETCAEGNLSFALAPPEAGQE